MTNTSATTIRLETLGTKVHEKFRREGALLAVIESVCLGQFRHSLRASEGALNGSMTDDRRYTKPGVARPEGPATFTRTEAGWIATVPAFLADALCEVGFQK